MQKSEFINLTVHETLRFGLSILDLENIIDKINTVHVLMFTYKATVAHSLGIK